VLERGDGQTSRPPCSREAQCVETGRGHAPGSRCALARPHRVNREGNKRATVIVDVIKCGRAGFASYVARDASIDVVYTALSDVATGRLACPPEISGGLLRALFRREPYTAEEPTLDSDLTHRECEVPDLVGRGFSNKEIGSELCLSVATVKHHVHHVLEKLNVSRRAEAMREVRDAPWLARIGSIEKETSERRQQSKVWAQSDFLNSSHFP
jgi:DNA-binding CsgD family transcriptional regulator